MAKLHKLMSSLHQMGNKKGSHLTIDARKLTYEDFARAMFQKNYQIETTGQIRTKHLQIYAEVLLTRNLSPRTIDNKLGHLRTALRYAGKGAMLKEPAIINKALRGKGGSRVGSKTAMSNERYEYFKSRVQARNPGAALVMEMQRALGLRINEAVQGACVDQLEAWAIELKSNRVGIQRGAKTGRARVANIAVVERAQAAVDFALIAAKQNGGFVLHAKNGKSAYDQLRNIYFDVGMKGKESSHSLRYAWSREQIQFYMDQGFSERQARKELSKDLGHGDGRARYVAMVYLR